MPERPRFVQIQPRVLDPRLPELGKIKIGGLGPERTSRSGKKFRLPMKVGHFIVTGRERGADGNLVRDQVVHAKVGDKPVELDVRLLWDEPAANFQSYLAAHDGKRRVCTGDGVSAFDERHGAVPCTCPWFKQHEGPYTGPARPVGGNNPVCKPNGRLSVLLEAAETFGGFYVFRTTSWESISSISAQLQLFYEQFGFLRGLPLRLRVYPATDTYEEGGQTKTSTSYKVAIVLRGDLDTAHQLAAAAYERRSQLALPSPAQVEIHQQQLDAAEAAEAEDIAAEFYPEVAAAVTDAEIVEEEDAAADQLEEICRYTLELADWKPQRINEQIAKYSSDLQTLAQKLQEVLPMEWQKAFADLSAAAADTADEEGEPEPDPDEPIEAELVEDDGEGLEESEPAPAAAAAPTLAAAPARPALGAEELL